jgi:hypothetical protein
MACFLECRPRKGQQMTTTNHTSPSGEDAANGAITSYDGLTEEFVDEVARLCNDAEGIWDAVYAALKHCNAEVAPVSNALANRAIGEREAFEEWAKSKGLKFTCHAAHDYYSPHEVQCYYEVWQARAALTAEKVAAAPVVDELAMLVRKLVRHVRKASPDNNMATMAMDYLERKGLAGSPLRDAAPQQPAQSAELDDAQQEILRLCRLYLDDESGKYNAKSVLTRIFSIAATQPAQTQVALTDAPRYREWLHLTQVGMWTAGVPNWARDHDGRMNDGIAMRSVIEELAALLAAQPVSRGKL